MSFKCNDGFQNKKIVRKEKKCIRHGFNLLSLTSIPIFCWLLFLYKYNAWDIILSVKNYQLRCFSFVVVLLNLEFFCYSDCRVRTNRYRFWGNENHCEDDMSGNGYWIISGRIRKFIAILPMKLFVVFI